MSGTGTPVPASPYRKISDLPPAQPLTGNELIPADQNGTVKITASALSGILNGSAALVVGAVPAALPNARTITAGTAVTFTDGGAGHAFTIAVNTIIATGTGLSGGGDLSQNRTLFISPTIAAGGPTGNTSTVPVITYNSQGQLIAVSTATITAHSVGALASASNLADVANVATSRTNLGALGVPNNLSDVASATTSRQNLGVDYGPDLQAGLPGQIRPYIATSLKTATWTAAEADRGTLFHSNSSASYTAAIPGATVSSGWYAYFRNDGAGLLTVTSAVAGVTIDGTPSVPLGTGDSMEAVFDGSNYSTIGRPFVPRGYLAGLTLSNDGGSPNSVIDVSAGMCADSTNLITIRLGAFTKSTGGAWVAGSGNNGMGQGLTVANNTWYHVFAAIIGVTPDVFFDTSATGSHAPAGIVAFRRIGSFKTAGGTTNILAFTQSYDTFMWSAQVADVNAAAPGNAAVTRALTVPPGVVGEAIFNLGVTSNNAGNNEAALISPLSTADTAPVNGNATLGVFVAAASANAPYSVLARCVTDTSGQVRSRMLSGAAGSVLAITTLGWRDFLGR